MKHFIKISISLAILLTPTVACADLSYNPERDAAIKSLKAIESATVNWQYQCGNHSLIINAYATQSDINSRLATVSGKIISGKETHNISELLTKAISKRNILTGQMSVACNADKGAFQLEFIPSKYAPKSIEGQSLISIFWDGTVESSTEIRLEGYPKK